MKGMGELHLDILVDRMRREFKVEANIGAPQVAYRETISHAVEHRPTPTRSRPAARASSPRCKLNIEPTEPGEGYSFESKIVGGTVPEGVHPGRREGHQVGDGLGPARGLPGDRLQGGADRRQVPRRRLLGPRLRDRRRGRACARACKKAGAKLLEPIMKVEVVTPEEYTGGVIGDLTSRRGMVQGQDIARQRERHHRLRAAGQHVRLHQQACAP